MAKVFGRGVAAVLLTLVASLAHAQPAQTGTISGVVKDTTGAVLPGVTLTLTSQERGWSREAVTDETGAFVFPALPLGNYTVVATLQGFESIQLTDNIVEQEKTTSLDIGLKVGSLTDSVQVVGETPIVDRSTVTAVSKLSKDEFENLPVGRSYQALVGAVPGVVGTGNVNSLGALSSNNLFIMDGVDTTDPTTGTFGTNLNFEAIQEVVTSTSAVSAEYGRGIGAIVNVVTKSGTNRFEGSFKYVFANDDWNAQNTTTNEVTGASLERVKFDTVNPVYAITGGGPIIKNRAFFFGAYEYSTNLTPQRQTVGQIPENYQQKTENKFFNVRGTVQVTPNQTAWVKYYESPTDGFIVDYWGTAGDKAALTAQNQSANNWAGQWSGVFRGNWAVEAAAADYAGHIDVTTYESGRLYNGSPIQNQGDAKFYNGATFDGYVDRPRTQFNTAATWFKPVGQRTHNIKFGFDFQVVESGSLFQYPNAQYFIAANYNQATGAIEPLNRRDYQTGDSTSNGKNYALFVRDKFDLHSRVSLELGLRYDKQTGDSDIGATTVSTNVLAPRLSGSVALTEDGKTLITGSYGRFHSNIIQGFSDAFANVPQQANYDNFAWNGSTYVFSNAVRIGGSTFRPNEDLSPYYIDEFTIGGQRELGRNQAATVRFISRTWGDIIDDVRTFNADNSVNRQVVNYDAAEHTYRGVQFVYDKRFSQNWSAAASYTYSRTRGNHFATNNFSALGDYLDVQCRTTVDLTVGSNGVLPCSEVQNGANKYGAPIFDRPHNLKFNGTYVRPIGPTNLVVGMLGESISKQRYEKIRQMNVLLPGTTTNSGFTANYFYNALGSDPVPGMVWFVDTSLELVWRIHDRNQAGFKAEFFNLTSQEGKTTSNNVVWCNNEVGTGCSAAIANYGKATARGSFQSPRSYRFSAIFRF